MLEVRQDAAQKKVPGLRFSTGPLDVRAGFRQSIAQWNGVAARALRLRQLLRSSLPVQQEEVDQGDARWFWRSFAVLVLVPVVASFIYFQIFASDQFISEMRFAVRGSTEVLPGGQALASSGLGTLASLNANQDIFIVADYINSQAIIDDLSKELDLRAIFNVPGADFLARFDPSRPSEEFLRYWRQAVRTSVEVASGVLTVEVRTFLPEDSFRLASAIRARCDAMVNQLLAKMRSDMTERAEAEVKAAMDALAVRRAILERFRNVRMSIDPLGSARSLTSMITQLRRDLVAVDVSLARALDALDADALSIRLLESNRVILAAQIATLEAKITGAAVDPSTASAALAEYDKLEVEKTLAANRVSVAEKILENARADADRQHLHLVSIEDPTYPQSSLFPYRGYMIAMIFLGAFGIWAVVSLTVANIRDHVR
jgi:capsular polysaccharide transport system permease protein